jgi:bacteriocin-like protein
MNNEIHELNINDLDTVIGGTGMDIVNCVMAAISTINDIQGVLGKAVDGIPPAPCHPK